MPIVRAIVYHALRAASIIERRKRPRQTVYAAMALRPPIAATAMPTLRRWQYPDNRSDRRKWHVIGGHAWRRATDRPMLGE